MKKTILLLTISVIILLILTFYLKNDYKHKKEKYIISSDELEHKKNSFLIEGFLMNYYYLYGEFPEDYRLIDTSFYYALHNNKIRDENFNYIRDQFYLDPFSKDSSFFYYKPIYNKYNDKREACLLLCAGIDGRINNVFPDTLYLNESLPIKVYNDSNSKFNYYFSLFGRKDLLVLEMNGMKNMKNFFKNFSLQKIVEYFKNNKNKYLNYNKMLKKSICTQGKVDSVISENYEKYILFKNSDFYIYFNLYYPDSVSVNIGDSLKMLGICNKFVNDTVIEFINAISGCNEVINIDK